MDVFYYWRNHDADVKAGRLGQFKSSAGKLRELADGYPDFVWAFKTPAGRRGEVQLMARLRWSDRPTVKGKAEPGQAYLNYDPKDAQSVLFSDSQSAGAIALTSHWVSRHFPSMLAGNFQGTTGQEALRGSALQELRDFARTLQQQPFSPAGPGS